MERPSDICNGGFFIEGISNTKHTSDSVVVFVHGLLGSKDMPAFLDLENLLLEKGFSTFRFNLYSQKKETRDFENVSIEEQVSDLQAVLTWHTKRFSKIYVVAHSMGAYLALSTGDIKIESAVLWDPSQHPRDIFAALQYEEDSDTWHDTQLNTKVSNKLHDELQHLPSITTLVSNTMYPFTIVSAKKGAHRCASLYMQHARRRTHQTTLDADHNFSSAAARKKLTQITFDAIIKAPPSAN